MKISALLLFCCLVNIFAAPTYSQSTKISLSLKDATIEEVLNKIEDVSEFYFLYNNKLIDVTRKVNIEADKEPIKDILNDILSKDTKFVVYDRQIILTPSDVTSLSAAMQQLKLTGTVTDEKGNLLPGVSVVVKGTTIGTLTDATGKYALNDAPQSATLIFSFVGMTTQEIPLDGRILIDVVLKEGAIGLEEVVVIGYGTQKKIDLTGSVSSVAAENITAYPVPGPQMGLQGKASGIQVLQNSGAPGAPISIRIRGGNSLLGNNEPLYVVDGFALSENPNSINPNDIKSIEVLKDASATAIYGSRGANGVVLITTKSGRAGRTEVTFNSYYAVQRVNKIIDMMNAKQFAEIANERAANDGFSAYFTQDEINSFSEGTNWQDELFRSAPMQNHSINVSGGDENAQYFVSGNLFYQEGVISSSSLQKISLRANLNQKISDKIRFYYNSNLSNNDLSEIDINGQKGGTTLSAVLVAPPTIAPYDKDGKYSNVRIYGFSPNELRNPLAMANERKQKTNSKNILVNTALTYEPVTNLLFKTSIGVESDISQVDFYSSSLLDNTPTGSANISSRNLMNILNENTLTYSKQFNEVHDFTALVGFTYQDSKIKSYNTGTVTGFLTDELETNNMGGGSVATLPASNASKWVLLSYLGRINYSYRSTYMLTASIRSDGSSRFGMGNKWGYFPSAAFAWRAINENFMKDLNVNLLSDLKFRLSWGITGNTGVSPYQTLNTLTTFTTVFNDTRYTGFAPNATNLANPDLKWETTVQSDAGVDIGFLKNRLILTLDYYRKNTRDLLANTQLPTSTGYSNIISNIGKIRNTGIEMGLNVTIIDRGLNWSLDANFSKNKSKVIELARGSDVFGESIPQPLSVAVNLVRVGLPVGVFYGYLEDGLNEDGAIKYKDLDGVAGITSADRTVIGDPNPDFLYNINSKMSYKNFELNYSFQGVQGGDIFNVNLTAVGNSFYWGENQLKELYYNHWSSTNPDPNAKYPKISTKTIFSASDRFVEDGSFLRLKNVQLAYNFPFSKYGIKWVKNLQLYISGQNLLTFTKYSWYDPEVNTRGGSTSISNGIDNAGYPTAKTYTFGARLSF